jgi:signal transduction histidine kinase
MVDAEKIDVILYNLLGNAIKFSPIGKTITIDISQLKMKMAFQWLYLIKAREYKRST